MVVAACGDEFEFAGLVVNLFGVLAGEEEAFDLCGGVQGVLLFGMEFVGVGFEHAAQVAGVGGTVLVDDDAEDEDFAVAEDVSWDPVESAPIDSEAEVAFFFAR